MQKPLNTALMEAKELSCRFKHPVYIYKDKDLEETKQCIDNLINIIEKQNTVMQKLICALVKANRKLKFVREFVIGGN